MPRATVREILERLIHAGYLHRLNREPGIVTLACPPDQIAAQELIDIGFRMIDESSGVNSSFFQGLRDAQRKLAADTSLAALL